MKGLVKLWPYRGANDSSSCPSKAINRLSWRPSRTERREAKTENEAATEYETELAVASEDHSLRIYALEDLLAAPSTDARVC